MLSEADFDLRSTQRKSAQSGRDDIRWRIRSGELNQGQIAVLALFGDKIAQDYMRNIGRESPGLRNPQAAGYFLHEYHAQIGGALSNLCAQALNKVRLDYRRSGDHDDNVERGLNLFQHALLEIRNLQHGIAVNPDRIEQGLDQDLYGPYNMLDNYDYWGQPVSMTRSWPADYSNVAIRGEEDFYQDDPRNRGVPVFHGEENDMFLPHVRSKIELAMGSLSKALRGVLNLVQEPTEDSPGVMPLQRRIGYQLGITIEGLIPILGINPVRSSLLQALS